MYSVNICDSEKTSTMESFYPLFLFCSAKHNDNLSKTVPVLTCSAAQIPYESENAFKICEINLNFSIAQSQWNICIDDLHVIIPFHEPCRVFDFYICRNYCHHVHLQYSFVQQGFF